MSRKISSDDLEHLIRYEKSLVNYHGSPSDQSYKQEGFEASITSGVVAMQGKSPILISSPYGAKTLKNEEQEYTSGIALLLHKICDVSVVATVGHLDYDPLMQDNCDYKSMLKAIVEKSGGIKLVIDIQGAQQHNSGLDRDQILDIGLLGTFRSNDCMSCTENLVNRFERNLNSLLEDCHAQYKKVKRNRVPGTQGRTVVQYVHSELQTKCMQLLVKPELRILSRKNDASNPAAYEAPYLCVGNFVAALVELIDNA